MFEWPACSWNRTCRASECSEAECCVSLLRGRRLFPRVRRGGYKSRICMLTSRSAGRRPGRNPGRDDLGWPFVLQGEFDDDTLISVVEFVRSQPPIPMPSLSSAGPCRANRRYPAARRCHCRWLPDERSDGRFRLAGEKGRAVGDDSFGIIDCLIPRSDRWDGAPCTTRSPVRRAAGEARGDLEACGRNHPNVVGLVRPARLNVRLLCDLLVRRLVQVSSC